ncbi:MAG: nitrophenyl compound nitroreductase subunit ArsF family protein [Bacteroidales bacterium]
MKTVKTMLLIAIIVPVILSCNAKSAENKEDNKATETTITKQINVYYFHFTRRCATCNAVEEKTIEFLKELYPEKMEGKEIVFQSLNLDEADAKEVAEKIGVSGQALVFIKGDEKIDLTSDGFMYARSNPEKLKEKIKETITNLML